MAGTRRLFNLAIDILIFAWLHCQIRASGDKRAAWLRNVLYNMTGVGPFSKHEIMMNVKLLQARGVLPPEGIKLPGEYTRVEIWEIFRALNRGLFDSEFDTPGHYERVSDKYCRLGDNDTIEDCLKSFYWLTVTYFQGPGGYILWSKELCAEIWRLYKMTTPEGRRLYSNEYIAADETVRAAANRIVYPVTLTALQLHYFFLSRTMVGDTITMPEELAYYYTDQPQNVIRTILYYHARRPGSSRANAIDLTTPQSNFPALPCYDGSQSQGPMQELGDAGRSMIAAGKPMTVPNNLPASQSGICGVLDRGALDLINDIPTKSPAFEDLPRLKDRSHRGYLGNNLGAGPAINLGSTLYTHSTQDQRVVKATHQTPVAMNGFQLPLPAQSSPFPASNYPVIASNCPVGHVIGEPPLNSTLQPAPPTIASLHQVWAAYEALLGNLSTRSGNVNEQNPFPHFAAATNLGAQPVPPTLATGWDANHTVGSAQVAAKARDLPHTLPMQADPFQGWSKLMNGEDHVPNGGIERPNFAGDRSTVATNWHADHEAGEVQLQKGKQPLPYGQQTQPGNIGLPGGTVNEGGYGPNWNSAVAVNVQADLEVGWVPMQMQGQLLMYGQQPGEQLQMCGQQMNGQQMNAQQMCGQQMFVNQINEGQMSGGQMNEDLMDGLQLDGQQMDGHQTEGQSQVCGHQMYGQQTQTQGQSQMHGYPINGQQMNGQRMNGFQMHGDQMYGQQTQTTVQPQIDGQQTQMQDQSQMYGHPMNGQQMDGHQMNEHQTFGQQVDKQQIGGRKTDEPQIDGQQMYAQHAKGKFIEVPSGTVDEGAHSNRALGQEVFPHPFMGATKDAFMDITEDTFMDVTKDIFIGTAGDPFMDASGKTFTGAAEDPFVIVAGDPSTGAVGGPFKGGAEDPFMGAVENPFMGVTGDPSMGGAERPFMGAGGNTFTGAAGNPFKGAAAENSARKRRVRDLRQRNR